MALNTSKCNRLTPLRVKGLTSNSIIIDTLHRCGGRHRSHSVAPCCSNLSKLHSFHCLQAFIVLQNVLVSLRSYDLWPRPWPDDLNIRVWPRHVYSDNVSACQNEVFRSRLSKVRAWTWQAKRQTDRQRQTRPDAIQRCICESSMQSYK